MDQKHLAEAGQHTGHRASYQAQFGCSDLPGLQHGAADRAADRAAQDGDENEPELLLAAHPFAENPDLNKADDQSQCADPQAVEGGCTSHQPEVIPRRSKQSREEQDEDGQRQSHSSKRQDEAP